MLLNPSQAFVQQILKNALDYAPWSVHGFGFLRLHLPDNMRLHIWDRRLAYPHVSTIHDHLQWAFSSEVISGVVYNHRYREDRCGRPYRGAKIKAGYGTRFVDTPHTVYLEEQPVDSIYVGQIYRQKPDEIHRTTAIDGTVTLIRKTPTSEQDHARVFWPDRQDWVSAEPRAATSDEICDVTSLALLAFPIVLRAQKF